MNATRTFICLALLVGLAACSQTARPPYAEAYRQALATHQDTAPVTPAMVDRFVRYFSDTTVAAADVYGEPLYFSDTLLTTSDREAALAHLERMKASSKHLAVEVIDTQLDGQDAYVVWQMRATFAPVAGPVDSNTVGVTHLRFDGDGRIVLQQDFWDSAEGFYRHVPVLGALIGWVKGRFEVTDA